MIRAAFLHAGKLAQVTLFDEQYAVVRRPTAQGGPAAVADRCPHRAAALSQVTATVDQRKFF